MPYRCGVGEGFRRLGIQPREPAFYCDVCQRSISVTPASRPGRPYAWLLDGKLPPKWKKTERGDECTVCLADARRPPKETDT
jgi:hypothetical protein